MFFQLYDKIFVLFKSWINVTYPKNVRDKWDAPRIMSKIMEISNHQKTKIKNKKEIEERYNPPCKKK